MSTSVLQRFNELCESIGIQESRALQVILDVAKAWIIGRSALFCILHDSFSIDSVVVEFLVTAADFGTLLRELSTLRFHIDASRTNAAFNGATSIVLKKGRATEIVVLVPPVTVTKELWLTGAPCTFLMVFIWSNGIKSLYKKWTSSKMGIITSPKALDQPFRFYEDYGFLVSSGPSHALGYPTRHICTDTPDCPRRLRSSGDPLVDTIFFDHSIHADVDQFTWCLDVPCGGQNMLDVNWDQNLRTTLAFKVQRNDWISITADNYDASHGGFFAFLPVRHGESIIQP